MNNMINKIEISYIAQTALAPNNEPYSYIHNITVYFNGLQNENNVNITATFNNNKNAHIFDSDVQIIPSNGYAFSAIYHNKVSFEVANNLTKNNSDILILLSMVEFNLNVNGDTVLKFRISIPNNNIPVLLNDIITSKSYFTLTNDQTYVNGTWANKYYAYFDFSNVCPLKNHKAICKPPVPRKNPNNPKMIYKC
jgi:hypothetical protein